MSALVMVKELSNVNTHTELFTSCADTVGTVKAFFIDSIHFYCKCLTQFFFLKIKRETIIFCVQLCCHVNL